MNKVKNKEANFISVVLYLHEDETDILPFLDMIYRVLENNFYKYELICVNDGTKSYVIDQIRKYKADKDIIISVVNMGFPQGVEAGMNAGVDIAIGDYVFEFDSGYIDYDESLIMDVYDKCMSGWDIVYARPPKKCSYPFSRIFYTLFNHYSDSVYGLATDRFCIISRRAINRVSAYGKTIPYRKAVYAASGLGVTNIEYGSEKKVFRHEPRHTMRVNTASSALVLFTDLAYRISLMLSVLMAVVMLGFGLYTVSAYFGSKKPVEGWSPLMGLISLGFLSIFILMTFLFKYLEVIVELVFKRQKYQVVSIEKLV